jgi:formate dehydrogenase subunit gamma
VSHSHIDTKPWDERVAAEIIAAHEGMEGATLSVLHALQAAFGFLCDRALEMTAEALNLSLAEIHGVVSFYHDFARRPPGSHVLKVCRAEACQALGGTALANRIRRKLRIDWNETTPDRAVTLLPVFCLGLCACAPAAMIDGRLLGRLDEVAVDELLAQLRS